MWCMIILFLGQSMLSTMSTYCPSQGMEEVVTLVADLELLPFRILYELPALPNPAFLR